MEPQNHVPPTPAEEIKERIKDALDYSGQERDVLCSALRMSCKTLSRHIEKGLNPWLRLRIAHHFGLSEEDFFHPSRSVFIEKFESVQCRLSGNHCPSKGTIEALDRVLSKLPSFLYSFTPATMANFDHLRSLLLPRGTFGSDGTDYGIPQQWLEEEIRPTLLREQFFLLHGNAGTGKTFFVWTWATSLMNDFDVLAYYSPLLHADGQQQTEVFVQSVRALLATGSRLLLILDDGHRISDYLKRRLFFMLPTHARLYLLMLSRHTEIEFLPERYRKDELRRNFNRIAEKTFDQILDRFSLGHPQIEWGPFERELRREIGGANLALLTLMLQSWDTLSRSDSPPSFDAVRQEAYKRFFRYYEQHATETWKAVHHVVAALFQHQIKIDKRYLTGPDSPLPITAIEEYLADYLIHPQVVTENNSPYPFYVPDEGSGTQPPLMEQAEEFQFYLAAQDGALSFGHQHHLTRLEFTKLVVQDYLLFRPHNAAEVLQRLWQCPDKDERRTLLEALRENPEVANLIREITLVMGWSALKFHSRVSEVQKSLSELQTYTIIPFFYELRSIIRKLRKR